MMLSVRRFVRRHRPLFPIGTLIIFALVSWLILWAFSPANDFEYRKAVVEMVKNGLEIGAVGATALWFLVQASFAPRIEFDVDLRVIRTADLVIAELDFLFENKGFVEFRLWDLTFSIHAPGAYGVRASTCELQFRDRIIPPSNMPAGYLNIVPVGYGYYFVRPGARQRISHIIELPPEVCVVRVTAAFHYSPDRNDVHTVRRVFPVAQT